MTGFQSKRGMAQAKTSMKDEALKLALEALEEAQTYDDSAGKWDRNKNAITAIKQALAQPVQESVAYQDTADKCRLETVSARGALLPQRQWVGLTDEEISALSKGHMTRNGFARNIEQALKAKNT